MKQNKSLCCFHTPSKQGAQLKPSTYSQWSFVYCFVQTFPSDHQPAWTADVGERLFHPTGEKADWSGSLWKSKKRGHVCVWATQPRQTGDVDCLLPKRVASGSDRPALTFVVASDHSLEPFIPVSVGLCPYGRLWTAATAVWGQIQLCCLQCGSGDFQQRAGHMAVAEN